MLTVAGYQEGIIGVELCAEYGEADLSGRKGGGVVVD